MYNMIMYVMSAIFLLLDNKSDTMAHSYDVLYQRRKLLIEGYYNTDYRSFDFVTSYNTQTTS